MKLSCVNEFNANKYGTKYALATPILILQKNLYIFSSLEVRIMVKYPLRKFRFILEPTGTTRYWQLRKILKRLYEARDNKAMSKFLWRHCNEFIVDMYTSVADNHWVSYIKAM